MTVTQLSASSVKVQLTADELRVFLPEEAPPTDSPQMMRLLAFMLMHAEAGSGIRFSALPVTVELLPSSDGGLIAYFTAQLPQHRGQSRPPAKTVRLAAGFADRNELRLCCRHLRDGGTELLESTLHQYRKQWVLSVRLHRKDAARVHHLLLEYGRPIRSSALNKARLSEHGTAVYTENAVNAILSEKA